MELQAELLLYLDKRRFLFDMGDRSEEFLKQLTVETVCKCPPLRYILEIDVMDLLNHSPCVGKLLLDEPIKFQRSCNKILYACLKSIGNDLLSDVQVTQVAVNVRLRALPRLLVGLNPRSYPGLVQFQGLLLDISKPMPSVYHTVWSCPEQCDGNEVIVPYIPKTPPKCYICRSVLFENSGLRRCGEQVIATFKVKQELLIRKFKIVDDLIIKLKLGSVFSITATILKKTMDVWSLEEVVALPAPMTSAVPADISELYNICDGIPWKFIYCLASSIGVNVCPLNCFMHLKISLLMSLTSLKANMVTGSSIIHVLAAGLDTSIVGTLMEEGAKLADTSIALGSSNSTVSTALLGSSGGVCFMPLPLHTYNQKLTSAILSAIESGEISHEFGRTKLRTAVWAQGMDFKKISLYNVASVFATVCRGDYGEYQDEIVEFQLQRSVEPIKVTFEEVQAIKDVALYVDLVSGIQVSLDGATESLLRNYFLAARKERTRGVSIGSMESLVATCVTSARLCRRTTATIDDAIFAIWLHVSGSPEPRFAPDEYLQTPADIKKLQKIFNQFIIWLEEFTGNCYDK
ncbi:uncharacterized protein LOC114357358 [Ostrinia furnacalis]|uniref:uncharacterized protein LOC114357358 n=1 Tax=Ostrinia furnacalis TaxID=93504 RepID=UPI00103F21B3|nr:uncharacterized protein LOC114357358 [Ostrinia furnacalis]